METDRKGFRANNHATRGSESGAIWNDLLRRCIWRQVGRGGMLTPWSRTLKLCTRICFGITSKVTLVCFDLIGYGIWNLHQPVQRQVRVICHSQREKGTKPAPHYQKYLTYFVNIFCPPRISPVEPTLPIRVMRKVTLKSWNHKHAGSWGTRARRWLHSNHRL